MSCHWLANAPMISPAPGDPASPYRIGPLVSAAVAVWHWKFIWTKFVRLDKCAGYKRTTNNTKKNNVKIAIEHEIPTLVACETQRNLPNTSFSICENWQSIITSAIGQYQIVKLSIYDNIVLWDRDNAIYVYRIGMVWFHWNSISHIFLSVVYSKQKYRPPEYSHFLANTRYWKVARCRKCYRFGITADGLLKIQSNCCFLHIDRITAALVDCMYKAKTVCALCPWCVYDFAG